MDQCFECSRFSHAITAAEQAEDSMKHCGRKALASSPPASSPTLEVQLQSELDLPRIVRSITSRSNFTKVGTREVARS